MTTFRDLPKSLLDAVSEVVSTSQAQYEQRAKKIRQEALKKFGVKKESALSESLRKQFDTWVQIQLAEASCGCEQTVDEDDMPGDAPFHKGGNEDSEKKKELDEEDKDDVTEAALKSTSKKVLKSEVIELAKDVNAGETAIALFNKAFGSSESLTLKELGSKMQKLSNTPALDKKIGAVFGILSLELTENVEIDADEIATNGAVGVTDANDQLPVHADVLRDTTPVDGKTEYRLFVQFNTNTLPIIVPPVTLPGAPTVDALRDVVEGLPFYCDVCEKALIDAADLPHTKPQYDGVVAEAFTLTQTDRLVIASIKRLLHTTDVNVIYNNTEYLARIPASEKGKFYHVGLKLEPSTKRLGKLNWVAHDQTIGDQDPSSKQKLASPESSLPFDQGDIPLSIRKLQELLQIVSRNVSSGSYAAQEPSF